MKMMSDETRIKNILGELKKIHANYIKRKTTNKDTIYVLEYLIAEYETAFISLEMRRKILK